MFNTVMMCIGILMFLFSVGWAAWDLRRRARERQQAFDDMMGRQDDNKRG